MMKNKMHLIPQIVIDCAENFSQSKSEHTRVAYELRLEAIRDYCDNILKTTRQRNFNLNENGKRVRK